ncbi:hypothetical protein FRC02_001964 [Tulasnella sp. 418]|nr:hypothetical protein FRC02_001964 [Tulasnella sp. 418]
MKNSHTTNITGVPTFGSSLAQPPPRLDIRTLVKDEKQFSLYIQAIWAMMKTDEKKPLSWFSLSAIHGLPLQPWDRADGRGYYCNHWKQTFPTWHRPYLALFEQVLQDHAVKIARTYRTDDKEEWIKAAESLRAPYWDWASDSIPPPEVIDINKFKQLNIIQANGEQKAIKNPLLSYTFHTKPRFPIRQTTVRCPSSSTSTETNFSSLMDSLDALGKGVTKDTFSMLIDTHTWRIMSNALSKTGLPDPRGNANSLEVIHGNVHVALAGEMGDPATAAFDPIFWLHHVNVDRLLALWQAIHPKEWMDSEEDYNAELWPFWKDANSYWKSTAARYHEALNYTYPEFVGLGSVDSSQYVDVITEKIRALYKRSDPKAAMMSSQSFAAGPAVSFLQQAAQAEVEVSAQQDLAPPSTESSHEDRLDWIVRVRTKLFEFKQSYTVLIFVGQPPEDQRDWRTSAEYVGSFCVFANSSPEECENCIEGAHYIVEGFVNLSPTLRRSPLPSLEPETVIAYLKDQIHWRIQKLDAAVVPAHELEALEVAVMSVPMSYSHEIGAYKMKEGAHPLHHVEITEGHHGGRGNTR